MPKINPYVNSIKYQLPLNWKSRLDSHKVKHIIHCVGEGLSMDDIRAEWHWLYKDLAHLYSEDRKEGIAVTNWVMGWLSGAECICRQINDEIKDICG